MVVPLLESKMKVTKLGFVASPIFVLCLTLAVGLGSVVALPNEANAETRTEDFDSEGAGAGWGTFDFVNSTGSGGFQGATTNSSTTISSPYAMYRATATGAGGVRTEFATSSVGVMSVWLKALPDANFEQILVVPQAPNNVGDYDELSIHFSRYTGGGTNGLQCGQNSQEFMGDYVIGAWYEAIIEWRQSVTGGTEARCGARLFGGGVVYSAWRGADQDYGQIGGMKIYSNATMPYVAVDNFYYATDADYDQVSGEGNSRVLEITYPTYATTTASTTFDVEYTYLNTDQYNGAKLFLRHQLNGTVYTFYDFLDETVINGTGSKEISLLANGAYTLQINLCYIPEIGEPNCQNSTQRSTLFNAVVADGGIQTVITTGYADYVIYPPESCSFNLNPFASSTFSWGDCAGYLMSPSTTTLSRLDTLTIEDKFPFAYMYQVPILISYLFQTSEDNSSTGLTVTVGAFTWTFINQQMIADAPITPFMRTVIIAVLYIVCAITVYRKIIKWHDKETTS